MAVEKDLYAYKRTPFMHVFRRLGVDWSTAVFKMQARTAKDSASADVDLSNAAAGVQGISAVYDPNYIHPETNAVVGATTITVFIAEATLEGLTPASPANDNKVYLYDLHATPAGDIKRVVSFGTFTVDPGVTQ
ncbi:hypothetical protein [Caenibius sp. WL]|uniref:hypothetical protein n=1 Tax=Caenibius sp. WL TaxID=2872646 RepID=UPI001C991CFA|nr:hypothetical protein [Caenibius sp. WL]QZP06791.1 hypothetical protein K5X80_08625 [Caenibius sp. WL]